MVQPRVKGGEETMPIRGSKDQSHGSFGVLTALDSPLWEPGLDSPTPDDWKFLNYEQVQTLRAVCDRIIPEDAFPSASQAGVLNYIDRQLAHRYRCHRDAYREGLNALEEMSRQRFGRELYWLAPNEQADTLAEFERRHKKYFNLFRSHTVEGYFGPSAAASA
jgi:hypothetical protein